MKTKRTSIAIVLIAIALGGCASRSERQHGRLPMSDVVIENRHDTIVSGNLRFGEIQTVAGGTMAKGDRGEHSALSGRIPDKASIDLDVYSGTAHNEVGHIVKQVHSDVDVRKQVPPGIFDAAFYFIIEQDFSLRLVVLSVEDYEAMKARHERPK